MKIGICGCGWLGQPLAQHFKQSGHNIVATSRSTATCDRFAKLDYTAICFALGDDLSTSELASLFNTDVLILNIPPGRKSMQKDVFTARMIEFVQHAKSQGVSHLVFISTTAVYGDTEGKVTETTVPKPMTDSAKAHLEIEHTIANIFQDKATTIRLAGLLGQARHPAKQLAGRTQIANGQQGVNLVHQQDVIMAISHIIEKRIWGESLHLSATEHPSREEYYNWAAGKLELPAPQFLTSETSSTGKLIDASWSLKTLGMKLQYPSPFDMLD